jgi:hypothetical protein
MVAWWTPRGCEPHLPGPRCGEPQAGASWHLNAGHAGCCWPSASASRLVCDVCACMMVCVLVCEMRDVSVCLSACLPVCLVLGGGGRQLALTMLGRGLVGGGGYSCLLSGVGSFPAVLAGDGLVLTCNVQPSALLVAAPADRNTITVSVAYDNLTLDMEFDSPADSLEIYDCNRRTPLGCQGSSSHAARPPCLPTGWREKARLIFYFPASLSLFLCTRVWPSLRLVCLPEQVRSRCLPVP